MPQTMTLTKRYLIFVAIIISAFVVGSLIITSSVVRSQLSSQLKNRLDRSQVVLEQYANVHYLSQVREVEAVATSPRFIAAVSTGDSATLAEEVPTYLDILDADILIVFDRDGKAVFASDSTAHQLARQSSILFDHQKEAVSVAYPQIDSEMYEVFCSDIVTADGVPIGQVAAGTRFSSFLAAELQRLTDFDVIVTQGNQSISHTESPLVTALLTEKEKFKPGDLPLNTTIEMAAQNNNLLLLSLPGPYSSTIITFAVSLDERLSPIMKEITLFLILLSIFGGLAAMAAIFWYTRVRIGSQINQLVNATQRISDGEMDFTITPQSSDELGFLAKQIESMRSRLLSGRVELDNAHAANIASERLAAVGKLTTGIIHDFKNPMAVVRASADMIRMKNNDNPKITGYCDNIHKQVDAMVELTRDVLEYSRGRTKLDLAPINLSEYISQIVDFHMPQYHEASIRLNVQENADFELTIDKNRLKRVFDNILNNAREACVPGDDVTIRWRRHDDGLILELGDSGPGIPAEILTTLFDPFVTSGKENGTGLGLAIAKKIVEDHGAKITVTSSPGNGTTFAIQFPANLVRTATPESINV
jgi:signal transduction histidine kinase